MSRKRPAPKIRRRPASAPGQGPGWEPPGWRRPASAPRQGPVWEPPGKDGREEGQASRTEKKARGGGEPTRPPPEAAGITPAAKGRAGIRGRLTSLLNLIPQRLLGGTTG